MFRRVFLAGIIAGLIAGALVTALQAMKLTPLIAAAEVYEAQHPAHEAEAGWEPEPGLERAAFTLLANLVIAVGFGLMLSAGFALRQVLADAGTDARQGLLWGLAGYACFSLAPALGLPPELPGSVAADLLARQSWWLGTALATGAGLALIVFARAWLWRLAGVALLALPHLIGAPRPEAEGGAVPASLAAAFAAASLVTAAVFWSVLGCLGGWIYDRVGRRHSDARNSAPIDRRFGKQSR